MSSQSTYTMSAPPSPQSEMEPIDLNSIFRTMNHADIRENPNVRDEIDNIIQLLLQVVDRLVDIDRNLTTN